MRIPILRGRAFRAEDASDPERLMIVNEEMARQFWPNENPVGQRIRFSTISKWKLIVGVAGDVNAGKPGSGFSKMSVYYPSSPSSAVGGVRVLFLKHFAR